MYSNFSMSREKKFLENDGFKCHYDSDGDLVAVKWENGNCDKRIYDESGGYLSEGVMSSVYVDCNGNT